jgi:hypothetical protein
MELEHQSGLPFGLYTEKRRSRWSSGAIQSNTRLFVSSLSFFITVILSRNVEEARTTA